MKLNVGLVKGYRLEIRVYRPRGPRAHKETAETAETADAGLVEFVPL